MSNFKSTIGTQLTGGIVPNATRIDSMCWTDGNDDEIIIEFWDMSGSVLRTEYNRRSTCRAERFIPVDSEEFARIKNEVAKKFASPYRR